LEKIEVKKIEGEINKKTSKIIFVLFIGLFYLQEIF